jgi:hypothetical protein
MIHINSPIVQFMYSRAVLTCLSGARLSPSSTQTEAMASHGRCFGVLDCSSVEDCDGENVSACHEIM